MKKIISIIALALLCAGISSCDKRYEENYDSIYFYDSYGQRHCRMIENYTLNNSSSSKGSEDPFVKSICVYYSGHWTVEIEGHCDWAYLSKSEGTGVHYFNFCYEQNATGESRTAVILLSCDNDDELEINLTQESL